MAYTQTARTFLATNTRALFAAGLNEGLADLVKIDITNVGTWWLDFGEREVHTEQPAGKRPRMILRAYEGDFMALVEGRMSVDDGLVTGRLHLAGDAASLARLGETVAKLKRN
jgi:putative sterol carrier protein